jgi:hypothetical protein
MNKIIVRALAAAAIATSCAVAVPALADNNECKEAQDQFTETSVALKQACDAYNKANNKQVDCDKFVATVDDIQAIVKSIAGVLGIGSKRFDYNSSVAGTIVGITKRLWVASTPAVNANTTIKVTHRDGKGKVKINVCSATFDPTGKAVASLVMSKVIEDSDTFTIPNSAGKNLSVELVGKEATHSFAYDLKVTN